MDEIRFTPSDIDSMVLWIDSIFKEINIGLLIYYLENPDDAESLRLIYANDDASRHTKSDLQSRVDMTILEAFPALKETDLPQVYADVIATEQPREIGAVEYADDDMSEGAYSVRAFPLPHQCVGIIFDDIRVRKQVDQLIKKQADELKQQKEQLRTIFAECMRDTDKLITDILKKLQTVKEKLRDNLPAEATKLISDVEQSSTGVTQRLKLTQQDMFENKSKDD